MTSLRSRPTSQRGFTLAELLVVIGMVTVMSALAIAGYRKYVNAAQASEAKTMIQAIRAGQEAYKAEMLVYLSCSTSLTDWYPQDPNDTKMNWARPGLAAYDSGWRFLNVAADGPVRFGYAVVAGVGPNPFPATAFATPIPGWNLTLPAGTPWYVIQAKNKRPGAPKPVYFVSSSVSSEIFAENDDQ